jgi:hypothetical protein
MLFLGIVVLFLALPFVLRDIVQKAVDAGKDS